MTQDLTAFLATLGPAQAAHRPWPRHILDRAGWLALLDRPRGRRLVAARALGRERGACIWRCGTKARWRWRASPARSAAIPPSRSTGRAPSAWSARSAISSASRPRGPPTGAPGSTTAAGRARGPRQESPMNSSAPRRRGRPCIRFPWARSMRESSSPGISASMPMARRSCGWKPGWAIPIRGSRR